MKRWIHAATYNGHDESEFDANQLQQIKEGLEEGLDISWYADPKFDYGQMIHLKYGLESGVDVSLYADPRFSWKKMSEIRRRLQEGKDVSDLVNISSGKKSMQWAKLISQLEDDCEEYSNPLYEYTDSAIKLFSFMDKVDSKLGVYQDVSVQSGSGTINFYRSEGDSNIVSVDYQDYSDRVLDIAFDCNNATEFKNKYAEYIHSLIA